MLSMGKDLRVPRLVDDYCSADVNVEESREKLKICTWSSRYFDISDIITSIISTFHEFADFVRHRSFGSWGITGLSKRLGGQRVKDAHRLLDEDQWHEAGFSLVEYPWLHWFRYLAWHRLQQWCWITMTSCMRSGQQRVAVRNGLMWNVAWPISSVHFRDLAIKLHDFQMSYLESKRPNIRNIVQTSSLGPSIDAIDNAQRTLKAIRDLPRQIWHGRTEILKKQIVDLPWIRWSDYCRDENLKLDPTPSKPSETTETREALYSGQCHCALALTLRARRGKRRVPQLF